MRWKRHKTRRSVAVGMKWLGRRDGIVVASADDDHVFLVMPSGAVAILEPLQVGRLVGALREGVRGLDDYGSTRPRVVPCANGQLVGEHRQLRGYGVLTVAQLTYRELRANESFWRPAPDPIIYGLDRPQAQGLACVRCGLSYVREAAEHRAVGRSEQGSLVYACERCPGVPERLTEVNSS